MAKDGGILTLLLRLLGGSRTPAPRRTPPAPTPKRSASTPKGSASPPKASSPTSSTASVPFDASPGRDGAAATREVDPHAVRGIRMSYSPSTDGAPDPGEIVWTWVPYEENDGRGKDRPVLVVATEKSGAVLAVQLTTKQHQGFVPLGAGAWDAENRPSYVNLDRVFRVQPSGMRREATALDRVRYATVAAALSTRYGW